MTNAGSEFHKGITVRVEGVRELISKLRAAGKSLNDLRELNHRLGLIVIRNARVPTDSGELAGSLRAGRGATKAVVRAGYAKRAAYAGVEHYGDPHRPNRVPHPFLTDALRRSHDQIVQALDEGIDEVLEKADLK